jgi:transcriptional regulator with XRE-family HTH domain
LQLKENSHIVSIVDQELNMPDVTISRPSRLPLDAAHVLTRAVLRAADLLGVAQRELAAVLGVSPASLSRLRRGARQIDPNSKEGEMAVLFVRVFRSLDALMGGSQDNSERWLGAHNEHLGGVPKELIQTVPGLVHVIEYLEAMRGNF